MFSAYLSFFFFFSSRRRHTRCLSDWSSDVCSSDLACRRRRARFASRSRFRVARRGWDRSRLSAARQSDDRERGLQIGRASCRERVESWVVGGTLKRKKEGGYSKERERDERSGIEIR